ncbi:MAG: hypothetical protein H6742_01190 [Alphaproteobacteria bacterium]|nr:hypothetical protein [Alphaproteobacteria bacterium]
MHIAPEPPAVALRFDKPAPGTWEYDRTHQLVPALPIYEQLIETHFTEGSRRGFEAVGALLECIRFRFVHGWLYASPLPVGAPPEGKGPPPKLVFKALLALHPALRRRVKRAGVVWAERPWLAQSARYEQEVAPALHAELSTLQAEALDGRPLVELQAHLRRLAAVAGLALEEHFATSTQFGAPVGRLLQWGQRFPELGLEGVARTLAGASPATRRPADLIAAVADAVRVSGGVALLQAAVAPDELLASLRAHDPDVAQALDAWLDECGWRLVGIDDMTGAALLEQPAEIAATLRAAVLSPAAPVDEEDGRAWAVELAQRLPAERRDEFLAHVDEARVAMRPREQSCSLLFWTFGLYRRAALAIGRAHVAAGAMDRPDQALFCRQDELLGDAPLPDREALRARVDAHGDAGRVTPPDVIGEPGEPPPVEWLPEAARELTVAVFTFLAQFDRPAEATEPLHGLAVSPGVVEGRAFVLTPGRDLGDVAAGDVLVALSTTSSLNGVLARVGGLVTEYGGLISHAAIVSRELGFPGVVGCRDVTRDVPHGAWVRLDGDRGRVEVLAPTCEGRAVGRAQPVVPQVVPAPRAPATVGAWVTLEDAADGVRFGGKAAHLAIALRAGLPAPSGVALDTDLVEGIAAGDPASLEVLDRALATLSDLPHGLAVRSSAPGEDGAGASFAGLHETELGLHGRDAVVAAVGRIRDSAHGVAALAYRARLGIAGPPRMAIVLQPLLAPDCAGVRFGRDPRTGADLRVIEAAPGLGVSVVDGRVRPDRYVLAPDGAVVEQVVGDKPTRLDPAAGGVQERSVESARAPTLDPAALAAVHDLGERCDDLLGGPQDVEWAVVDGVVRLLQSRPVTTGGAT